MKRGVIIEDKLPLLIVGAVPGIVKVPLALTLTVVEDDCVTLIVTAA
jgi:hypothetical protein